MFDEEIDNTLPVPIDFTINWELLVIHSGSKVQGFKTKNIESTRGGQVSNDECRILQRRTSIEGMNSVYS